MPAKFSLFTVATLPLLPIALACGGDDGGGKITIQPDAPKQADAMAPCTAEGTYSMFVTNQFADNYAATGSGSSAQPRYVTFLAGMNMDIDALRMIFLDGYGTFSTGLKNGTYAIAGDETSPDTCTMCVLIASNVNGQTGAIGDWYMATGGTVTLNGTGTASGTGTFAGSLSNVTFAHIGKDGQGLPTGAAVDNCTANISSINFSATLMVGSAAPGESARVMTREEKLEALTRRFY
jgi:hypothetical protein